MNTEIEKYSLFLQLEGEITTRLRAAKLAGFLKETQPKNNSPDESYNTLLDQTPDPFHLQELI